jgi:hypothetical protein
MKTAVSLSLIVAAAAFTPPLRAQERALDAFSTVREVFQHPRCQNCHIPGNSPLQYDAGRPHAMSVVRGPKGEGAPGLPCASCHGEANPPAAYGPHAPPGAPHWKLPPPNQKMAWIGLSAKKLCESIKDPRFNGGRDLAAMLKHVSEDKLVLWGWGPGGERAPVSVPHGEFVARFKLWVAGGAPCPAE